MKIAITSANNKIATTFDFVDEIVLFTCNDKKIIKKEHIVLLNKYIPWRAKTLKDLNVGLVICGAISKWATIILRYYRVKILSGITGDIDTVIMEFLNGNTRLAGYRMPGFSVSKCRKNRSQKRRRMGYGKNKL